MSNKTQLQANNAKLDSLIQTLQGKATGGSGGGSIETCTIVVDNQIYNLNHGLNSYAFTTFENGEISTNTYDGNTICQAQHRFENVVCGSVFYMSDTGYSYAGRDVDASILPAAGDVYNAKTFVAPTEAGAIATITFYDDD